MRLRNILVVSLLLMAVACGREETVSEPVEEMPARAKVRDPNNYVADCKVLRDEAMRADSVLLMQVEANDSLGNAAIHSFTDYGYYCRFDSLAPVYLVKAAQVARVVGKYKQAEQALQYCIEEFRDFRDRPAAIFLLAQLYEDASYMQDGEKARQYYKKILTEHPRSVWAKNAEAAMSLVGMTEEQLIQTLKKKKK